MQVCCNNTTEVSVTQIVQGIHAYNWGVESQGIGDRDESHVYVIEVNLALGLEFVDEI